MMCDPFSQWIGLCFFVVASISKLPSTSAQDDNAHLLRGSFVARQDLSFTFASTDRTIPGIGFALESMAYKDVEGMVVDAMNSPVAGAEIWFSGFYGRIPLRERATSLADGTFRVKLPMDDGLGKVQWASCAIHRDLVSKHVDIVGNRMQFTMGPGRKLIIRAAEEKDGKPTGEFLRDFFLHLQDGRIIPSAGMGVCEVSGMVPEVQYVIATAPGHVPYVAMLDFSENRDVELKASLQKGGQVIGQVRNGEDQHVPFNPVHSWTCERSMFTVGHGISDAEGHYALTGIAIGRPVRVSTFSRREGDVVYYEGESCVVRSSHEPTTINFQVRTRKVAAPVGEAILPIGRRHVPNGLVRGIVRLPDGTPCPQFNLKMQFSTQEPVRGGWPASYGSFGITFANPRGTFLFSGVPAGTPFRAVVSADGFCDVAVDPVVSMESESLEEIDLHEFILKPALNPQISVTDIDGNEIDNAIVELYRSAPGRWIPSDRRERHVATGTTDIDGHVVLASVPIEMGRAIVIAKGFGEQQFDWNDGVDNVFQLQPVASLKIQIQVDIAPESAIEFNLVDEVRAYRIKSGKVRFRDGIALWEIPEILPGKYRIEGTGAGNEQYDILLDGALPQVFEMSQASAYELELRMERK